MKITNNYIISCFRGEDGHWLFLLFMYFNNIYIGLISVIIMKRRGHLSNYIKGQVTIFILVAVLLVGIAGGILLFSNKNNDASSRAPANLKQEVGQIDGVINDCVNQRAIDAIRIVGLQGGYIILPEKYIPTQFSNIAYGYYDGKNTLPSKTIVENEIKSYIESTIPYCIVDDNFESVSIVKSNPSVRVSIEKNIINVDVKIPVSVTKKNDSSTFTLDNTHSYKISVRLGDMIDTANLISNKQVKEGDYIPVSYLLEFDYNVIALTADQNNVVYAINDDKNKLGNVSYSFLFGAKLK